MLLYIHNNMVRKGQIIINPKTQRPVKVGSRTWLKLVKEGICEGVYDDPNELYTYEENEDIEEKRQELNKKLPLNKQAVKGRGKYKNKLVVRNKRLNPKQVADYTRKNTIKAVVDNLDDLENLTDEEIEAKLEQLIMRQMIGEQPKAGTSNPRACATPRTPRFKRKGRAGKPRKNNEVWEVDEESDGVYLTDEEEDEEEDSDIEW